MKSVCYFLTKPMVACLLVAASFAQKTEKQNPAVTAVTGESWLTHLHRTFDDTSMGKTGRLGPSVLPPEAQDPADPPAPSSVASQTVALYGADLYRMNCRGCHGEFGLGAPPEINSVINPVRASSVASVMARMRTAGMDISRAEAAKLAAQSRDSLLQRLHHGGQDMPPFPHLSDPEVRSLVAYLKQLADVAGASREQVAVKESQIRIGEHIVKSTCHICHGAAGANPTPLQLADGAIPPLSTLTARTTRTQFIRKVTQGAPVLMGTPAILCRGRMPVFYYLSEDEAADAYQYLTLYAPSAGTKDNPIIQASQENPAAGGGGGRNEEVVKASFETNRGPAKTTQAGATELSIVLPVAGLLVGLLLAGGLGFTVRELRSLAMARQVHQEPDCKPELEDEAETPAPSKRDLVA